MKRGSSHPPLPVEFRALDDATRAALGGAGRADEWDAPTRAGVLAWLAEHRDALAAIEARVLTAEREAGTWGLHGDRDMAGFVGRMSRHGRGAGLAAVGQAATLAAMPAVAEALVDGPVTTTHVQQLTRATAASPALAAELATPEGQERVVELARRTDGGEFGRQLKAMSAALDPATRQREHDEQRANRCLDVAHTPGGTLVRGWLDSVAGHELAKALDALTPRPAVDDERTRGQRWADALVAMCRVVVSDKRTTPGAVAPVQAVVAIGEDTWTALRRDRWDAVTAGSTADVLGRLPGTEPVLDETGRPWPASEIGRALCDCALTRAVVGADGTVLDLGRKERLFTSHHWLALYASGVRTCAVDGCGMPLAFTELHHMRWWKEHGGRTDMANLAPECSFHHHEIHRLGIAVTRRADGSYEHRRPDGRLYGGAPPRGEPPGASTPRARSDLVAV